MPLWITSNEVLEYFFYSKNQENIENSNENFNPFPFSISSRKLLQIADFFNNQSIIIKIIKEEIIPSISEQNSLLYLEDSYEKLTKGSQKGEYIDNEWFDLFYASIDFISKNFLGFLTHKFENLILINKTVLGEIVEK